MKACAYVTELIGDTGERRAETGRAHLRKLDRDDTPCALHTKLQPERACRKPAESARQDPERNECTGNQNKDDDGEATTDELRYHASNGTTAIVTRTAELLYRRGICGGETYAIAPQLPIMVATVA